MANAQTRGIRYTLALVAILCAVTWLGVREALSQERRPGVVEGAYTFGRVHAVMKTLQAEFEALLEGFLSGNVAAITQSADEVVRQLDDVMEELAEEPERRDPAWRESQEIARHATNMQRFIRRGDYRKGYREFTAMGARCIACHQVRRPYGTFPATSQAVRSD